MGYILQGAYAAGNHWAVFEGWTLAGSYVLAAASKSNVPESAWSTSFYLCELGATEALSSLCLECTRRDHLVEGDWLTDGHFYHARVTLLVGLMSALDLPKRIQGEQNGQEPFIRDFVSKWLPKMKMWGESATPYFVMAALETESMGQQARAESFLASALGTILEINGRRDGSRGLPSPYYSPEQSLRLLYQLDQDCREDFVGAAYTVYPLMDFLVRRLRREVLRGLWYPITGNSLKALYPDQEWEWFRWRAESGVLNSRFVGSPQSWSSLVREVQNVNTSLLPSQLRERPAFAVLFALV